MSRMGNEGAMIRTLLLILLILLIVGAFTGPRYYRSRRGGL